jgi:hypothetical protein
MKTPLKGLALALVAGTILLSNANAQIMVSDTPLTITGSNVSGAAATVSQTLTAGVGTDVIVAEVGLRDASGTPNLPSTLTYTVGSTVYTLNSIVAQNSVGDPGSFHDVAIYYDYITPTGSALTGTIGGTLDAGSGSGNDNNFTFTAFTLSGVNTVYAPTVMSSDAGTTTGTTGTNTLTVGAGNFAAFAVASGPTASGGTPVLTLTSTTGTVTQTQSVPESNNYDLTGYVSGLSAGSNTFTTTITNATNNKLPFAVADFQAVPEPSTWALMFGAIGLLMGVRVFRTQRQ